MRALILQIVYFDLIICLEIVSHSPGHIIAKSGESLELFCDSNDPYLWCLWKHNRYIESIHILVYGIGRNFPQNFPVRDI